MEKLIYTAMTGAQQAMLALQVHSNNLANVNTTGFRADFERASSYQIPGGEAAPRVLARPEAAGMRFTPGALMQTDRKLDVAIRGEGWLTVGTDDGSEAYTRAGNLLVEPDGRLTLNGRPVMGEGGEISLPEFRDLDIGQDGTLTLTPPGGGAQLEGGRLKLVQPPNADLVKGRDGLLRLNSGQPAEPSDQVVLASGYLEGSNVNPVDELIQTLSLSRNFELQVRLMKSADDQARSGDKLISGQG